MKNFFKKLFFLLLCFPLSLSAQQDPLYNQYFFNQAMINPAYTGVNDVFNATAISRTQWAGMEGAPTTNNLNVSTSAFNNKIGLGATLLYDSYGINSNTEFNLAYSFKIRTKQNHLISMGLQAGLVNYNYDYNKLNLQYMDDIALLDVQQSAVKENFGLGFWYMSQNYYIGLSVPRVLDVRIGDGDSESTRYRRHYYLSAGYVFDQLFELKFKPSIMLVYMDKNNYILDMNASFLLNETLWVGASLRNLNAVGLNAQLKVKENIKFGYAFELPINNTSLTGFGSHSLMASLDLEIFKRHGVGARYF
ncbi:type IX secretion system membrane protein PorP/SprF [Marivirga sp. S37H4]|uniref:Type IX secretion system membrane protein PorP/SprF n=1 Tax=Marivirga aurantiaca TaxID=2802615 RepID=A0A935C7P4_9BACT|nr:type IX secretion system membrane protein PorP/SprF [Marivirga aurantiaca]MBK6265045.1 type IX secretion system membrane protein PorP/SprF [Marivirga aurantiaca]